MKKQEVIKYRKNENKCNDCGVCSMIIQCPGNGNCIGCGSCYLACPNQAYFKSTDISRKEVNITIDHKQFEFPIEFTIKQALIKAGYLITKDPTKKGIFTPCETGGCYACAVIADEKLKPACHSGLKEGLEIKTDIPKEIVPLRIVQGFQPHSVGGVGTPWELKNTFGYIEVACFTAGCNFRCPTCQNFTTTYNSNLPPLTPRQAAEELTKVRHFYNVNRLAISGGEPTLNRKWLIQFFRELKRLNDDKRARLHLDTNASLLTKDYIDELINVGITDIGPDLKSHDVEIFSKIIGIDDKELVKIYMENAWSAVEYIANNYYPQEVFIGVGLPYNKYFYANLDHVYEWGTKLTKINPDIQVSVLDYRPTFRNLKIKRPSVDEMMCVKSTLQSAGLKKVIIQTVKGHIGP